MHEILESDNLSVILDYLGFVPARYFLRNSCRDARRYVPASVEVSLEELGIAIRRNLVPLKFLVPRKVSRVTSENLVDILAMKSTENRGKILNAILSEISPGNLANNLTWNEIEKIKWTAWLTKNVGLLKLAIEARKKKQSNSATIPHFQTEFLID